MTVEEDLVAAAGPRADHRKGYLAIYANSSEDDGYVAERFAGRLPKATVGRSCVRIKRLDDLDPDAVRELVRTAARVGGTGAVAS